MALKESFQDLSRAYGPQADTTSDPGSADYGALTGLLSGAEQSFVLDNPLTGIGFRSVMYGAADLYAALRPSGGTLDSSAEGSSFLAQSEGRISREDFESTFVSQHPGLVGKWRPTMSWFTANGMLEDLQRRDTLSVLSENNTGYAAAGGFIGGIADPSNFFFPEAQLAKLSAGKALGKAAAYGLAEGATSELITAPIQNYYLQEDRTIGDTAINILASSALPPALHLSGRVVGSTVNKVAAVNKDDLVRVSMGQKPNKPEIVQNLRENAINAAANFRAPDPDDFIGPLVPEPLRVTPTGEQGAADTMPIPSREELANRRREFNDRWNAEIARVRGEVGPLQVSYGADATARPTIVGQDPAITGAEQEALVAKQRLPPIASSTVGKIGSVINTSVEGVDYRAQAQAITFQDAYHVTYELGEGQFAVRQVVNTTEPKARFEGQNTKQRQAQHEAKVRRENLINPKTESDKAVRYDAQQRVDTLGWSVEAKRLSKTADDVIANNRSNGGKKAIQRSNWVTFMQDFLRPLGREIRFYDPTDAAAKQVFGEGRGAAHFSDGNTVYIAANQLTSIENFAKVVGHEVGHTIIYNSPAEWRRLVKALMESGDPALRTLLKETMDDFTQSSAFQRMSLTKKVDETLVNVIGQAFESQGFWTQYRKIHGDAAFNRFAAWVKETWGKIIRSFRGDEELNRFFRSQYANIESALKATSGYNAAPIKSQSELFRARRKIGQEFGERWHDMTERYLSPEDQDRLADIDQFIDDLIYHGPDEAADESGTVTKTNKQGFVKIKLVKLPAGTISRIGAGTKKSKELVRQIALSNPGVKNEVAKVMKAWGGARLAKTGDTGDYLLTYRIDADSDQIEFRIGYPDTYNPVAWKGKPEFEFSRSQSLVNSWFSDFGLTAKEDGETYINDYTGQKVTEVVPTQAAEELMRLEHIATKVIFDGLSPSSTWSKEMDQLSHPLVKEFVDSPEFRGMFDLLEAGQSVTEIPAAGGETLRNKVEAYELFFDALNEFTSRRKNEETEKLSDLPDKYAQWQDRIQEARGFSGRFTSVTGEVVPTKGLERKTPVDKNLKPWEEVIKFVPESETSRGPAGPVRMQNMLNDTVTAFYGIWNKARKKAGAMYESLPFQVQRQLYEAAVTVKSLKDQGITYHGTAEDIFQLKQRDLMGFKWSNLLDVVRDSATGHRLVADKIVQLYGAQVPIDAPNRDIQMYDLWEKDLFQESDLYFAEKAVELKNAAEVREDALDIVGVSKDAQRAALVQELSKVDPARRVTIDGITATVREHFAHNIMREIIGDSEFTRWVIYDSKRTGAMDADTLAAYRARKDELQAFRESGKVTPAGFEAEMQAGSRGGRTDTSGEQALDYNDYEYGQAVYNAEMSNPDINPEAAARFADEVDNMPVANQDLRRFAERNQQQTDQALKPYLELDAASLSKRVNELSARVKKIMQSVQASAGTVDFLKSMGDALVSAKFRGDSMTSMNKQFLDATKNMAPSDVLQAIRQGRSGLMIHDKLLDSVKFMAIKFPNRADFEAALTEHVQVKAQTELLNAAKNYEAVTRQYSRASIEQLQTDIDGNIRVSDDNVKRGLFATIVKGVKEAITVQAKGQYLVTDVSVEQRMKMAKATATLGLHEALNKIPKPFGGGTKEMASVLRSAITALLNPAAIDSMDIDPAAKQLVKDLAVQIDRSRETVRGMLNKAGAVIRKNDQFFFSLQHNLPAIRKNVGEWQRYLLNRLDWDETFSRAGIDPNSFRSSDEFAEAKFRFLDRMLGELELRSRDVEANPWDPISDDLSTRDTFHRVLNFKNPADAVDYDMDFGSGDTMTAMLNQFDQRAERSVMIDTWGPDYRKNFEHVVGLLSAEKPEMSKVQKKLFNFKVSRLRTVFRMASGELNNPVNQTIASIQQSIGAVGNAAFSWMSTPSSLTDIAHLQNTMRSAGAKYHAAFGQYLSNMVNNSADYSGEVKEFFRGNLAGLEAIISSQVRADVGFGAPGFGGWANDKIFAANGQKRHTRVLQYMYSDWMGHHLGEMANQVKSGNISPEFQRWLDTYQITAKDFAKMAESADSVAIRNDGVKRTVLLPSMVEDPGMRRRLMAAFKDTMDHAVLQPTMSDQAYLTFGTRSGTASGAALRLMTQYKSFTLAMNRRVARRFRMYGLSDEAVHGLGIHRFMSAAHLMGTGLLATQLKDVLSNREPLTFLSDDQRNFENLHRVVLQAGMFTMMGDLGLGTDGSLIDRASRALGPVPGQALKFASQVAADDPGATTRAVRTLINSTPGSTLPLWNTGKHHLIGTLFSDSYELNTDMVMRNIARETGQDQNILNGIQ